MRIDREQQERAAKRGSHVEGGKIVFMQTSASLSLDVNFYASLNRRLGEVVGLALILLPLLALKMSFNPSPLGDLKRDDGAFYYQIARHVAEGDGLQTSVSLYHWGLRHLPHPSFSYPLWTLLLGTVGRIMGLPTAAQMLPELFYFTALVLLYGVAQGVAGFWDGDEQVLVARWLRLNAGHWAVVLFGLNPVFFEFTSLPFAEGLAFSIAFGALLLVPRSPAARGFMARGAIAGFAAALSYLARSQMLGLPAALVGAMGLAGLRERAYWRAALACLLISTTVIFLWAVYVFRSVDHFAPMLLIDHTSLHESPELAPHLWLVEKPFVWDYVKDCIYGLGVAFDPTSPFSYVRSFGPAAYLVPLSILFLAAHRRRWRAAVASLRDPAFVPVAAALLSGLAALVPVHNLHSFRWGGWFFQFRHGLPLIFPVVVAIPYLMTRNRMMRAVVILLLAASVSMNGYQLLRILAAPQPAPTASQRALSQWIDEQPRTPVFLSTVAAPLGALTRGSFHWIMCDDLGEQTREYFNHLGVDYLVTTDSDRVCPFFTDVKESLEEIRSFGTGDKQLTLWRVAH